MLVGVCFAGGEGGLAALEGAFAALAKDTRRASPVTERWATGVTASWIGARVLEEGAGV